MLIEFVVIPN